MSQPPLNNPEPPLPGANGLPPVSGSGRTEDDHWRWVLRRLGGGIVDIELTSRGDIDPLTGRPFPEGETHQDDCLRDTRRWFVDRVGWKKWIQIALQHKQTEYVLPADVLYVTDVVLPTFEFTTLDADQFGFTYFSLLFGQWVNPSTPPMPFSELAQRLQYLKMTARLFSNIRNWRYDRRTRVLSITPAPIVTDAVTINNSPFQGQGLVEVMSRDLDVRHLDPQEEDFFQRKLLIEAMFRLATIRSTVDSFQMPGGDRSMNGADLQAQAEDMQAKLNEDVRNLTDRTEMIIR